MKNLIIKFYRNRKKIRKIKFLNVISFYIDTDKILVLHIFGEKLPIKIVLNKNEYVKLKIYE